MKYVLETNRPDKPTMWHVEAIRGRVLRSDRTITVCGRLVRAGATEQAPPDGEPKCILCFSGDAK